MQHDSSNYEWENADNEPDSLQYDDDESILDVYDGDTESRKQFDWGYQDAGKYPWPREEGHFYLMGFRDRQHEIFLGIPADLEFLPDFEEF